MAKSSGPDNALLVKIQELEKNKASDEELNKAYDELNKYEVPSFEFNFKNALNIYAENERAQTFYNNESMEKLQLTDTVLIITFVP
mgnify:CR=1 FL=1